MMKGCLHESAANGRTALRVCRWVGGWGGVAWMKGICELLPCISSCAGWACMFLCVICLFVRVCVVYEYAPAKNVRSTMTYMKTKKNRGPCCSVPTGSLCSLSSLLRHTHSTHTHTHTNSSQHPPCPSFPLHHTSLHGAARKMAVF